MRSPAEAPRSSGIKAAPAPAAPPPRPVTARARSVTERRVRARPPLDASFVGDLGFRVLPSQSKRSLPLPRCLTVLVSLLMPVLMAVGAEPDAGRVREIAAMLSAKPAALGRHVSDREAWEPLATHPEFKDLPEVAARLVREGLPGQSNDLYLDYSRTGNRDRWQRVASARRGRVATFTLAECVENKGRFLRPLEETIEALCTEKTWVYPAHDGSLRNFKGEVIEMDLASTMLSWELATAFGLLGDKLSPASRQRVRENLARRTFTPFRAMLTGKQTAAHWLRATHNWNAVCLAGTVGAALAVLDSPEERAWFAAAAEEHIRFFLSGFTSDGYCSEGLGYWNYGFGYFVMLSETLRQATVGKVDLLADPKARMPALFPLRAEILNGVYPSIADCSPGTQPDGKVLHYLCKRFSAAAPQWTTLDPVGAGRSLYTSVLFSFLPSGLPALSSGETAVQPGLRTWFKDGSVLICRPAPGRAAFAACLKGGHNAEHHNHNDLGSFSVVCGKTMILCDPGAEVYTARTFSSKRYDSKVLSSYGHSVPVVAGQLQRNGGDARAIVRRADFSDREDVLTLDIRSAYRAPELKRMVRDFTYRRGSRPFLAVQDEVEFASPAVFETALITWSTWKKTSANVLQVGDGKDAVHVQVDTGGLAWEVSDEVLKEEVRTPAEPRRIAVRLKEPLTKARLTLTVLPAGP